MKRKFLSIVSLFLAVMMILPMGVFVYAEETGDPTTDIQIFDYGDNVVTEVNGIFGILSPVTLTAKGGDGKNYEWLTSDSAVLSVSGNGSTATVTVLKPGNANIVVTSGGRSATVAFNIDADTVKSIKATFKTGASNKYVSGQTFDKSTLVVEFTMDSNNTGTVDGSDPTVTTSVDGRILTSSDTSVIVYYNGKQDTVKIEVSEKSVKTVDIDYMKKQDFTEGEGLPEMKVKVTYNDNTDMTLVDGFDIYLGDDTTPLKGSYKFKLEDNGKSIYVKFNGVPSSGRTITVTKKNNDPVTDGTYTVTVTTPPTKKEYRVGDKFDKTGMKVTVKQIVDGKEVTIPSSVATVNYTEYTITEDDLKNKNYITLPAKLTIKVNDSEGKVYDVSIKVTGLTIRDAAGALDVYEITDVEMVENSYPVGYKFNLDDIDYFWYKESKSSSKSVKVSSSDIINKTYTNDFTLEVLTNKNDKPTVKSSRYMYTLEEGDIFTDTKRDTQYAYLRLTIDRVEYDFTIKVGGSGVYYYYDSDLIETYDDIDYAIKYTMEQDKNVKDKFDLDRVKDSKDITLKLGEDQKVSTKTDFELCHNVTIDLAGHKLDFYTDTVDIIRANRDYTLTIANTSSTSAKFTYVDEEVEITLAKGDKIVFEYDKDIPGIYTITLDIDTNGKVTTTPAAGKNDTVKVGQGSDVKFTITPSTDYELDTIKLDTKTVAEKDYTKSSTGVVTYTLKSVTKSQKVTVTFKKSNTAKNWNNPFTDVSATDSYYSAVKFVYENNLFKGTTTTKFGPDTTMTRAMFVTVLGRLAGVDVSRFKTSSYSDVPINATTTWYAPYVEWATQMGLVEGYGDGTFGPDNKITHQQMYVLMYKYSIFVENKKTNISGTSINASDAEEVADWAKDAVKYASQQNFLVKVGTSSRINPTGEAKRSELAQLLEKYCDVVLDWNSSNK